MQTGNMLGVTIFQCFMFVVFSAYAREFTDDEYSRLPQVFHLDDYHRCLTQKDGLYCLGTLQLTPEQQPHPIYELIKEYANKPGAFNRTLIRRGYCVSARCPSSERNATLRFEHCAASRARPLALRTRLHTLHYCRTHQDTQRVKHPDTPQRLFIYIIYTVILLNITGTIYDLMTDGKKKNKYLIAWSIQANWERLTMPYEIKDPRLSCLGCIQGARVVAMVIVLYAHTFFAYNMLYLQNPRDMERDISGLWGVVIFNGTTLVQMFVMISSFLCAYNLLLSSNKTPLKLNMLPKNVLKRFIRISPINLLFVGYGATWWVNARDGPLWSAVVGTQGQICKRKFWTHALFVNNFVNPEDYCYIQTWFLAVDMQLHILALLLTLSLARFRACSVPVLAALFLASCLLSSTLAYINGWKPVIFVSNPENIRILYRNEPSFLDQYIKPLGSLQASLMGLLLAHLQYQIKESGYNISKCRWLVYTHNLFIPLFICWLLGGEYIRQYTSPIIMAAYVGIDKFVFSILCGTQIIGAINIDSFVSRFFAWRGWDVFGRMSLSVMMIHWFMNLTISVPRPHVTYSSMFNIGVDTTSTIVFTYFLAVPATVLVEIPMQRFLDNFIR